MEYRNLDVARNALVAIKGIAGDALAAPECVRPPHPRVGRLTRPELAYGLKRLQHAELVHYLRCDASREVLLMVRQATEEALYLLDDGDEELREHLSLAEPFRHHYFARSLVAALFASEREAIRRESAYWRRENAVRSTAFLRMASSTT